MDNFADEQGVFEWEDFRKWEREGKIPDDPAVHAKILRTTRLLQVALNLAGSVYEFSPGEVIAIASLDPRMTSEEVTSLVSAL